MAGHDVSVGRDLLPGLLGGPDGLAKLVETVLNQILEAQVTESLGAERHERTEGRAGYRNGSRARTLYTRVAVAVKGALRRASPALDRAHHALNPQDPPARTTH